METSRPIQPALSDNRRSDTEIRPDGAPTIQATTYPVDLGRDGHVRSDLGARLPGADEMGRGSGGGAPEGAAGEAREHLSLTILRLIETKPKDRVRYCGAFSIADTQEYRYHRVYCRTWGCSWCGPRKAKRVKWAIRATAEAHHLSRFVSLTLDPKLLNCEEPVQYLNSTFAKLRTYIKRRFKVSIKYIRVLEFQQSGMAHFHLLIDRYIPQAWLQWAWQAVGGGKQVNVKYVDIHRVSPYLSKYLTKELLMSAPKRSRRVTTSRSIHLFEKKPKDPRWQFLRLPIEAIAQSGADLVVSLEFDEGGALKTVQERSGTFFERAA